MINEMALEESKKVFDEDQDERAKIAMIRYESRLDAYQFLQGKFENFHAEDSMIYQMASLVKKILKWPYWGVLHRFAWKLNMTQCDTIKLNYQLGLIEWRYDDETLLP